MRFLKSVTCLFSTPRMLSNPTSRPKLCEAKPLTSDSGLPIRRRRLNSPPFSASVGQFCRIVTPIEPTSSKTVEFREVIRHGSNRPKPWTYLTYILDPRTAFGLILDGIRKSEMEIFDQAYPVFGCDQCGARRIQAHDNRGSCSCSCLG